MTTCRKGWPKPRALHGLVDSRRRLQLFSAPLGARQLLTSLKKDLAALSHQSTQSSTSLMILDLRWRLQSGEWLQGKERPQCVRLCILLQHSVCSPLTHYGYPAV